MDLAPDPVAERFRAEVTRFLDSTLPPGWAGLGALGPQRRAEFTVWWRDRLRVNRLLGLTWPEEYGGGGRSLIEQVVLNEEFVRRGVPAHPHPNDGLGFGTIGPTILLFGDERQKARFLPRIVSGEDRWAQGYSEPRGGSDLFGLQTSAVLENDVWVINGQKVWQSEYELANWIFLLVRTEPVPGRRGISVLLVPLEQDGVEVRPVRTMTGRHELCELFFTDATTASVNLLGGRGEGARIATSLLGFERGAATSAYAAGSLEFERLLELVAQRGLRQDAAIRLRVAECFAELQVLRHLGLRALTTLAAGVPPGPESSIAKLRESEFRVRLTALAMDVLGRDGAVRRGRPGIGYFTPEPLGVENDSAVWVDQFLTTCATTIYGGSTQIQRNILGERLLGLPREPAVPR